MAFPETDRDRRRLARALFDAQEATTGCLSRELWQLYLKVAKDLPPDIRGA